ncbi:MAG: hypothetical protein LAT54_03515, partial [Cryomorphaceae bacterium]|nr:hypothetical protein [Cryomorphaceae bacterium]
MKNFSILPALFLSAATFVGHAQQNYSSCLSVNPTGPLNFLTINDAVSQSGTCLNAEPTSGCAIGYPLNAANTSSNDTLVIKAGHTINYDNNFYVTNNQQSSETRQIAEAGTGHVLIVFGTLQHSNNSSTRNLDIPVGTTMIIMPGGQLVSNRNNNRLRVYGTLIVEEGGDITLGGSGNAELNIEGTGNVIVNGSVTANNFNINGALTGTGTIAVSGNGDITGNGTVNGQVMTGAVTSPLNLGNNVPTWTGTSWKNGILPANGLPVIIEENALNGSSPMDLMQGVDVSQITINAGKELVLAPGQSIASGFSLYMRDNAKIILDADENGYAMIVFDGFRHMNESAEIVFKQHLV